MTYCSAIVVAAGKGRRFKSKVSKPLVEIRSKPIIIYSLQALAANSRVKEIIVVANKLNIKKISGLIEKFRVRKVSRVVLGGKERRDSVRNGLRNISRRAGLVLIHDAGRPFIKDRLISAVIRKAAEAGAAIAGVPVKATIKRVKDKGEKSGLTVQETLKRDELWEIQTPQVFERKLLERAFSMFPGAKVTDEAMLVEKTGRKVAVVLGSYDNLKITTPEDLVVARAISGA